MSKYKKPLIKILISTILFGFILSKVDRNALIENIKLLDLRFAPLIILLLILNYVISSVRWKALLIHKNGDKVSVIYLTYLYFIGSFFNNFMPTSVGGDVFKIYKLGKKIESTAGAFAATFMERFTGVIALVLISSVSLIHTFKFLGLLIFVGFWICALVGFLSLHFLSFKFSKLKKVYDSLIRYKGENKVILAAFISSFLVQLCAIFTQYFIFTAIGVRLPLFYSMFIIPLIILASFFVPSLNGVGVQDALYIKLFGIVGVSASVALSASILYHLFRLGVSLIGGILYAMGKAD